MLFLKVLIANITLKKSKQILSFAILKFKEIKWMTKHENEIVLKGPNIWFTQNKNNQQW